MYPGEGMYVDDQPVHRHHLPITDDDDDDDGNNDNNHHHHHHNNHDHDHDHDHGYNPYAGNQHHNHPPRNTPPPSRHHPTPPKRTRTPTPTATPQLRPQQPLQPPTPLNPPQQQQQQPPTPLRPPVQLQPPTPLPPQPPLQFQQRPPPNSPPTPRKPNQPPPMDLNHPHHYNDSDDNEDKYPLRQLGAVVFIILLLFGLTALILWLIYRPTIPQFTAVATLIYSLNTTVTSTTAAFDGALATVAASMQFIIHTRNPNKRTTLTYDHLAATVYYRNTAITPPVALPPLYHRKKSSVIIAPVIGGPPPAVAIPVAAEVAEELAANEAYGVVGFSWVVVGRVRYRAGGFKSGHSRVYVRCDVVVRLNGVNNGVYINPGGQVPLLASPPCLVDI